MSKFVDLIGKRFGRLVVQENTNNKSFGAYIWKCQCDCGNISYVSSSRLNSGKTKSCGCYKRDMDTLRVIKPYGEASFNSLYNRYKQGAKKRNINFDLSKEEFKFLTKQICFYCGCEPYQIMNKSNKECNGTYVYNGIDRVDNNLGYIKENCVSACGVCNRAKDIMGIIEFSEWITNLKNKFLHDDDIKEIKIKYQNKSILKVEKIKQGDWIDLRSCENISIKKGEFKLIPLGVAMEIPKFFEAHILPRSSTFKNFKIIMANGMGIVDNSFCGNNDFWFFPAIAMEDTTINKNDRICQFRIIKKQPEINFIEVEDLGNQSRGGFGSTGRN